MKKFLLSAMLLSAGLMGFAADWDATDVNVAKGCQTWISAYWGGDKANMTDDKVDGTNCQLKVEAPNTVEWVVVDLGYEYDITKISLTTTGDRKDKSYAFYYAPSQATAPVFADGNDVLADVWVKGFEADEDYENVNFSTKTNELTAKARYIKYQAVERNHSDIYGTAICEIRVAGTTNDPAAFVPASIDIKGVPTISVGQSGNIVIAVLNSGNAELTIDPAKLSATSSNTAVATAAVDGTQIKVTGVAAGTANITISYDGVSAVQPITVGAALTAAPVPTRAADQVLSLYSNAYDPYDYGWYDWGGCILDPMVIDGDNLLHAKNWKYLGSQFKTNTDVSEYDYFHVDIYPTKTTTVGIVPITQQPEGGNSPERGVTVELNAFEWNSIDIPMQDFVDAGVLNLDRLYQLKYNGKIAGTDQWNADGTFDLYLDNVYFYKDAAAPAVPTLTAEAQNITINGAEIAYTVTLPDALADATVKVYIDEVEASASPIVLTGLTDNTEYTYTLKAVATLGTEEYESKLVTVTFKTLRDASNEAVYYGTESFVFDNAWLPGEDAATARRSFPFYADYSITYTTDGTIVVALDGANMPGIVGLVPQANVAGVFKNLVNTDGVYTATFDGPFTEEALVAVSYYIPYDGGLCEVKIQGYHVGDEAYVITDGVPYTKADDFDAKNVKYTRTYGHAEWQGWHMPFDVALDEITDYVAINADDNKYEVIEFVGVTEEDGVGYAEFTLLQDNGEQVLKANTPYLFMPKATGTVTYSFANKAVSAAEAGYVLPAGSSYELVGTYDYTKGFTTANAYVLSGGAFCKTNSDEVTLKPYRAYLNPVSGNSAPEKMQVRIRPEGEDNDTDAIEAIGVDVLNGGVMYDLNGRQVSNPTRGIYILNGQKIIIR